MRLRAHFSELSANARAALISAMTLGLAGVSAFQSHRYLESDSFQSFEYETFRLQKEIQSRLDVNLNLLLLTQGLFLASREVTREEFARFVEAIEFSRQYAGILGLGFALKVDAHGIAALERGEARYRRFRVWPRSPGGVAFPIYFLQPANEMNLRAMGYDMYSDPERRNAMDRAIDTGRPATTALVTLVQEREEPQPGFLIYVPVFRERWPLSSRAERLRSLMGFVYSPYRSYDLFDSIVGSDRHERSRIDFKIFAGPDRGPELLIYHHDRKNREREASRFDYFHATSVQVADARWRVEFRSLPGYRPIWVLSIPLAILFAGAVIAAFTWRTVLGMGRRTEVERAAKDRLQLLYDSSKKVFGPIENAPDLYGNLVKALVPVLADVAGIIPADEDGNPRFELGTVQGRAEGHAVTDAAFFRPQAELISSIIRGGAPVFIPEGMNGDGIRAFICVGLQSRGRLFGALALAITEPRRRYRSEDRELVMEIAKRAGVAIENTFLFQSAQEAVEVRDNFISIASHELKTPLTTLALQNQIARRYVSNGSVEARLEHYERIMGVYEGQVRRLVRLVEDMLDATRLKIGKLELSREEIDLADLAREVMDRLSNEFRAAGCETSFRAKGPVRGTWDRFRLDQVVTNLLTNAIKYGAGKPIEVSVEARPRSAILKVSDQGIGIAPENRERVFERYERAISSRNISGLGLGLYIAREIVEAHGGKVRLESEEGKGSTFIVELPSDVTAR
ncbi:MAG: CHASE domain-containing protein [Oligoflexia bacterium]|nr:CHASE domain-containing protein [Oligoflexia bacterium]